MFKHARLENGLTIIGEVRESASSCAIGFFVRTGARDEVAPLNGVSHFLEHMLFKGTPTRSALDISYALGAIGAQANAFTSEENTVYYMAILPEYLERGFELLSDMMRPALDGHEFATEKKVILEEIALYQDRPTHVLFEASLKEYFHEHPAGNSVLGSVDTVSALSREQMKSYFDSRYTAPNIVLAAAGNFDWPRLLEMAGRFCAAWPAEHAPREVRAHRPRESKKTLTKDDLNVGHLVLMSPGPDAKHSLRYPVQVLSCILGDASGSKTYWKLIDTGLAESASIELDEMDGTGFIYGYVSAAPERIDQVAEIMREVMLSPSAFSEDDLARAKTKLATRLVLQGESSMRRLMSIGLDWVYRGEYETLDEEVDKIKRVERKDIVQALEEFDFRPLSEIRLLPG